MNIDTKIELLMRGKVELMRMLAPYDTGNLSQNAIKLEHLSKNEWTIKVNEQVAPYMPYTNEEWISPKWKGKKNPNEGWWDKAVDSIMNQLRAELGGTLRSK